jgi:Flp pilus assembly protein TadD
VKRLVVFLGLAQNLACAHPASTTPSAVVKADVERADDAERHRRHDEARRHYEQAIADAKDPASQAFARRELAETLGSWGDYAGAIAQLEAAVAARPDDAAAWHDLGILRHHEHDDAGALAALERARTLAPDDPRPRIALAALRWSRGDVAGATTEYRGLLALDLPERLRQKVEWALEQLAKPDSVRNTPRESP